MTAAALRMDTLVKEYKRGQPVLKGVSLDIAPRGVTAIIGASGTGKSTLIRCINRLVEPTSGAIHFDGQDLTQLSGAGLRAARRRIGMVFQEYNLSSDSASWRTCSRDGWVTCRRSGPGCAGFRQRTSIARSTCSTRSGCRALHSSARTVSQAASAGVSASLAR
jgi:hypothetical protein